MIKRICKDCKKEFTISDSEIKFYKDKNLELPKRCSDCRSKNKQKRDNEAANQNNEKESSSSKSNTLRNIIIAAVILIASFFGFNVNSLWDSASKQNSNQSTVEQSYNLTFRNDNLLKEHFQKHGSEFNYKNEEQYVKGAIAVVNSSSSLHKTEAEDGDEIYYDKSRNEIVFVSKDGYIRTYFKPSDGINYYNRQ